MRRNLLALALGIGLLVLLTWAGTFITTFVFFKATPQVQAVQAGPYHILLRVDPNPPRITEPTTISIQVMQGNTQVAVTNAHVTVESTMLTMDMGTEQSEARFSGSAYEAQAQLSMSGPWQLRVIVAVPGARSVDAVFKVSAR